MTKKGCDNCYYSYFDERAYPCSLCIRGIERTDQWQPSKKTKADTQIYWRNWKDQMWAEAVIEPQTDCKMPYEDCEDCETHLKAQYAYCNKCKWYGDKQVCGRCRSRNLYAPKDEPQRGCDAYCNEDCIECAKETELWKAEQTEPQTEAIQISPRTDCSWK